MITRPYFSQIERLAIWGCYDGICYLCERIVPFDDMHIEHVIPLYLSKHPDQLKAELGRHGLPGNFALNSYKNLRPAHSSCNSQKGSMCLPTSDFMNMVLHELNEKSGNVALVKNFLRLNPDFLVCLMFALMRLTVKTRKVKIQTIKDYLVGLEITIAHLIMRLSGMWTLGFQRLKTIKENQKCDSNHRRTPDYCITAGLMPFFKTTPSQHPLPAYNSQ